VKQTIAVITQHYGQEQGKTNEESWRNLSRRTKRSEQDFPGVQQHTRIEVEKTKVSKTIKSKFIKTLKKTFLQFLERDNCKKIACIQHIGKVITLAQFKKKSREIENPTIKTAVSDRYNIKEEKEITNNRKSSKLDKNGF